MHASSKVLLLCICFFFPLEKKCFKGQIRKHSLCMRLPKCFCCASVSSSLGEEVLQGTNKKPLLMHASSKVLLLCICFFFPLEKNCFKGQIAKHSLLVHASSKVLLLWIFAFPLQNKCFQGTRGKFLLLPELLHFGKTFCPFCLASLQNLIEFGGSCWWQEKAQIEETKKRELAELQDKVEEFLAAGTLPNVEKEKRSVGAKIRDTLACNHGG